MKEATGNLWTFPADWRVITTNGYVKTNGECVMGRGCAAEAKAKYPGIALRLGKAIDAKGNILHVFEDLKLITFPVKHKWNEEADFDLMEISAKTLEFVAAAYPDKTFVMPRPGCGNGRRSWDVVKSLIENILPDNITVITYGTSK